MKHFGIISAIIALLAGLASSGISADCHGSMMPKMCHRTPMAAHHCDMEMMRGSEVAQPAGAGEDPSAEFSAHDSPGKCPMNCCSLGSGTVALGAPSVQSLPTPAAGRAFQFISVVFVSSGFSSHTDRGPPLA